ncbi:uncharacterized protein BJX67DRAFT_384483 [Aspergillus lucknowensis]|uniref:CBF1-interacting co-repressor CIR N-terminal domain-containing protein n=1 Tax=Aspergillus lucknowensis TaxID=176173 RepID=A0ABR4LGF5_9EURO
MPLHLLGKKSWNVYNPENIARVRRDEAQAKAKEEEEDRRMQEADAERRIRILRGERPPTPPPPPPTQPSLSHSERKSYTGPTGGYRKRRRLAGENDTDRDIRFAREDAEFALTKREELRLAHKSKNDAPLYDKDGHINLFPGQNCGKNTEKNPEGEKEAADKLRTYEDQYTMRLSNAAGFRQSVGTNPWYSSFKGDGVAPESIPSKDVWGNEDPMRKEREKARIDMNDPLLAMKKGVHQLKSVEIERKKWNLERSRELDALKTAEKAQSRRHKRRSSSKDSLENFKLDDFPETHRDERGGGPDGHRRHSRNRTFSRSSRRHSSSRSRMRSPRRRGLPHKREGRDDPQHKTETHPRRRNPP